MCQRRFWGHVKQGGSWALQRKPSVFAAGLIRTFNGLCYEQSQCMPWVQLYCHVPERRERPQEAPGRRWHRHWTLEGTQANQAQATARAGLAAKQRGAESSLNADCVVRGVASRVPKRGAGVGVGWRPFDGFSQNTRRASAWAVPSAGEISPWHFHSEGSLLTQLNGGWGKHRTLRLMGGARRENPGRAARRGGFLV